MKSLILVCLLIATVLAYSETDYQTAFTAWMQQNGKSYHHDEFQHRYQIFKGNMDFIQNWNTKGYHKVVMNKFGDLDNAEFSALYNGFKMPASGVLEGPTYVPKYSPSDLPDSYNWATKGAVTGIKNQEQCGSCWSFSTTGSTEGCHEITKKNIVGLSEQNLMDCSTSYGNEGCEGGLMTAAMQYIIDNKGIDSEASYPYTAEDGTSCNYVASSNSATLASFTNVATGSESDLESSVYEGPTSVAIDASHDSFQFYSSGVYYEPDCSSQQLDHGVLAVGWGSTSEAQTYPDYWVVKNSWGADWGNQGYIWMARNADNNCGIATAATLPSC